MNTVAFDIRSLSVPGGVAVYTENILEHLLRQDSSRQYNLIGRKRHERFNRYENAHFIPFNIPGRFLNRFWRYFKMFPMNKWIGRSHLFYSPNFTLPLLDGETKTVITIHDLAFLKKKNALTVSSQRFLEYWIRYSIQRANRIVCVSEATRQDVIRFYGADKDCRCTVISEGANENFRPLIVGTNQKLRIQQKYGLPGKFNLFLGTLEPRKNIPVLVRACHLLRERTEVPDIVIAGRKGWLYDEIFELVKKLQLETRVHFPGEIENEDLPWLYNLCELLILPSLDEGFGLPVLEAMRCGKSVIISDRGALPDLAGDAGIVFPAEDVAALADAISKMSQDHILRRKLEAAALLQSAKYSWEKAASDTLRIFNELGV